MRNKSSYFSESLKLHLTTHMHTTLIAIQQPTDFALVLTYEHMLTYDHIVTQNIKIIQM